MSELLNTIQYAIDDIGINLPYLAQHGDTAQTVLDYALTDVLDIRAALTKWQQQQDIVE